MSQTEEFRSTIAEAVDVAHSVVWATATSVDHAGRPRGRILHPLWVATELEVVGWVLTRRTPVKVRHLAANPHLSFSYLALNHDVAFFDCVAAWTDGPDVLRQVWAAFVAAPPPVGYDPATIFPDGPGGSQCAVLQLRPYRIQVARGEALARGERPRRWQQSPQLAVALR
jgi:hypothetical protein